MFSDAGGQMSASRIWRPGFRVNDFWESEAIFETEYHMVKNDRGDNERWMVCHLSGKCVNCGDDVHNILDVHPSMVKSANAEIEKVKNQMIDRCQKYHQCQARDDGKTTVDDFYDNLKDKPIEIHGHQA